MLDLKKIQQKFDSFFETETEDSFNKWLEDKKTREILLSLGKGQIEQLKESISTYKIGHCPIILNNWGYNQNVQYSNPENIYQYAMAA